MSRTHSASFLYNFPPWSLQATGTLFKEMPTWCKHSCAQWLREQPQFTPTEKKSTEMWLYSYKIKLCINNFLQLRRIQVEKVQLLKGYVFIQSASHWRKVELSFLSGHLTLRFMMDMALWIQHCSRDTGVLLVKPMCFSYNKALNIIVTARNI